MEARREKATQSSEKKKILIIPDDILIEILSRLPVKSLLRLKCTCKYWLDLLRRNPGFIKMHLLHRHQHSTPSSHLLLISCIRNPLHASVSYSVNYSDFIKNDNLLLLSSPPPETIKFDYTNLPIWLDNHTIRVDEETENHGMRLQFTSVGGSCNGLICLYTICTICYHQLVELEFFLWNPSTREIKKLPSNPYLDLNELDTHKQFHGFCYDHTIDDYKIIIITIWESDINIYIYTLGSNSWRKKKIIMTNNQLSCFLGQNNFHFLNDASCFHNGALHWITTSAILCFDIVEETEKQEQLLQLPNYGDRGSSDLLIFDSRLQVINGCVCVINYYEIELHRDTYVELWMMKDYGVNESWTKLFTIDPRITNDICGTGYLIYLTPIEICKVDGGILMLINGKYLALYDLKNEKHRWVHKINPIHTVCVTESYKESMVSLNSGIYLTDVGSITTVQEEEEEEEEDHDENEEE